MIRYIVFLFLIALIASILIRWIVPFIIALMRKEGELKTKLEDKLEPKSRKKKRL